MFLGFSPLEKQAFFSTLFLTAQSPGETFHLRFLFALFLKRKTPARDSKIRLQKHTEEIRNKRGKKRLKTKKRD